MEGGGEGGEAQPADTVMSEVPPVPQPDPQQQQPTAMGIENIPATLSHGGRFIQYNIFGNIIEVTAKYKPPIEPIGEGAYGIVCSALNSETNEHVAIKKIANAFDNKNDAKRTLREIKLLRHMDHENVVAIRDIIPPPQRETFNDVYLAYEFVDTDLHQIICSKQALSEENCQEKMREGRDGENGAVENDVPSLEEEDETLMQLVYGGKSSEESEDYILEDSSSDECYLTLEEFESIHEFPPADFVSGDDDCSKGADYLNGKTCDEKDFEAICHRFVTTDWLKAERINKVPEHFLYQILRGLKYIHSANVVHGELKPSNLLLNLGCDLKICDFGPARVTSETDFTAEDVVTRWYRAPELLLNSSDYTAAIDVWSVGCIFMELMDRKPLFPGRDHVHQLRLLIELIGTPSEGDLGYLNENAKRCIRQLPLYHRQSFQEKFPHVHPVAIDLVEKMLTFDPRQRITVEDALAHPYLTSLHDISDEPVCMTPFSFDFEQHALTEEQMKELIYREALAFNPEYQHQ